MNTGWSEERLNALVDGELTSADAAALLEQLPADGALRDRVCQLRLTKEMIRHAYGDVAPAPSARPAGGVRSWRRHALAVALFGVGLLAGWLAREGAWRPGEAGGAPLALAGAAQVTTDHVVLHVASAEADHGLAALEHAAGLIDAARGAGMTVTVEIVANGSGLDLLRTAVSPHAARIEAMRREHPTLTLVACGQTVQKLREAGADTRLLPGTVVASSALDQIVRRMQEGWAYVRL